MNASNDVARNHSRTFQNLHVLRNGRRRHRETSRDLTNGQTPACEPFDDAPPRRIPERRKHSFQVRRIVNHQVNYSTRSGHASSAKSSRGLYTARGDKSHGTGFRRLGMLESKDYTFRP